MAVLTDNQLAKVRRFIKADARSKSIPVRGHLTSAWDGAIQDMEDYLEGDTSFTAGQTLPGVSSSLLNTHTPGLSAAQKRCFVLAVFDAKHNWG